MSERLERRTETGRRHRAISVIAAVIGLMFLALIPARHIAQADDRASPPLELHLTSPPRWTKGCLFVALDRINRSTEPLFLTKMGPYFEMALDVSTDENEATKATEWVNIYGGSNILVLETLPIAPGATLHNEFCLSPTVWVVNQSKKTRREIPVRGILRVRVTYFLTEDASQRYKQWFTSAPSYSEKKTSEPDIEINPGQTAIVLSIPCTEADCKSSCTAPPRGITGEARAVPDVFFIIPEWGDRGKALTNELARKSPRCPEDKSNLHRGLRTASGADASR